jgi:hypothetical protein
MSPLSHNGHSVSRLGTCPTCENKGTVGSGTPNGVDCRCGQHFHFGDDLWVRADKCIVCPSCGRALSPLDFKRREEWVA